MYEYRPPIDLANPQRRKLASALGPAYVRASGTWANSVYFANLDSPPTTAPAGFSGVLTRKEWKGVIDFVQAVNGKLATSFATSVGTRDPEGVWTTKEAGIRSCLHEIRRRADRGSRVHERAHLCCHGRRTERLQRS